MRIFLKNCLKTAYYVGIVPPKVSLSDNYIMNWVNVKNEGFNSQLLGF